MTRAFGDLERLLKHVTSRLRGHPGFADVRHMRALVRIQSGDWDGARADLEAALGVNPEYAAARFGLAWLLIRSPSPDAGRAVDLARPLSADARTLLEAVRVERESGVDAALRHLEGVSGTAAELQRLWLLVEGGRWDEAERAVQSLVSRDPDLPAIFAAAGLLRSGTIDRGMLAEWAVAHGGNPHFGALCRTGADLAHAAGDLEASRRLLSWSVALSLDLCSYWVALGAQHDGAGEERAALAALRNAVRADPDSVAARAALGYHFAAQGRVDEAIVEIEAASRLGPRYADVHYELGLLLSDAGRPADAERELRTALDVQPGYVLARLALGVLLESGGRDAEALAMLQHVRRAGLRSADLESHLAALHARLGHANQARRARSRARAMGVGSGSTPPGTRHER